MLDKYTVFWYPLFMGHLVPFRRITMRYKSDDKKQTIKNYIEAYYEENGYSPTVREIEAGTGISKTTVQRYLSDMGECGNIEYSGTPRGARTEKTKKDSGGFVMVGLVGRIACGTPNFAEENIEEYFRLPVSLVGKGTFYFLRAFGDSMVDAGINEGDLVLIKKQNTAKPGEIVVALVDDETTLKRYYPDPVNRRIRLHPENKDMCDIYVDNCEIQGVAVKVLKDLY